MKKRTWIILGAIAALLIAGIIVFFSMNRECDGPEEEWNEMKPIIYLYPEEETEVTVTLGEPQNITCAYPAYGDGWTVVALHWGPYTTGDHGARLATTNFIQRLTPLFASNRVDLVLQAHDHTYSKTLPYRWDGTGFTTNRNDRAVVNLRPAQIERDGAAYDHHPNGTYYLSCGAAGHRVGENVSFAAPTGTLSFTTRPYWIAANALAVDSPWGRKGDVASADLPRSMFGVLRVEGRRLVYEAYVVGTNGTATLYCYANLAALQAAQQDVAYFIVPLYRIVGSKITLDMRRMPVVFTAEVLS